MDPVVNLWNKLPEECKAIILQHLSTKELARAARISMEFAETVRDLRNGIVSLVLPPNMKLSTLQGMVAAHPNLGSLSFKRCGAKLKTFIPLLEAATGSNTDSVRGVPVFWRRSSLKAVDFRGCVHLKDSDIAELCWLHSKIEEVNLANCQALTDSALITLSRHRRSNNVNNDSHEDELDYLIDNSDRLCTKALTTENQDLNIVDTQAWPLLGEQTSKAGVQASVEWKEDNAAAAVLTNLKKGEDGESSEPPPINMFKEGQSSFFCYAQAAARSSDTDCATMPALGTPKRSDDGYDMQAELEKIKGWPKKDIEKTQVHRRSKTNGQVGYERPATQRDADTTSTLSGGKLRFASLLASKKNERCLDPMSERSGLQSVCVAGCNNVTDKGVQSLLKGFSGTSLVSLDVSRCAGVGNNGLRLPPDSALQNLTGVEMSNITRLRFLLSDDQALRNLNLAGCIQLEELVLVAPRLQTLNLPGCRRLITLQLKCPNLEILNISLCDNLHRFGRFECSGLQVVNANGCRLLSMGAVAAITDSSMVLQEIRLSGCDQIDGLNLPQLSLLRLEIPGCSSLKRVVSQSRILSILNACGCKNLEELRLQSPFLQRVLLANCSRLRILVMPFEGIRTSALALLGKGENGADGGFEISIKGAFGLPEAVRKSIDLLARQLKCVNKS